MLPLTMLNAAQGHAMMVELKNGESINGHLMNCDTWMNLTLKEAIRTHADGFTFTRLAEIYIRGNNIKFLRVGDDVLDIVKDQQQNQQSVRGGRGGSQRGDHGGRGDRGRGGSSRGGRGRGRGRGS